MSASYQDILISLGYNPKDFGSHYRMAAIYRNGTNAMSLCVRKNDGAFIDFGGKKYKGNFKKLLQLTLGEKSEEIKKYLEQIENDTVAYIPKQQFKKEKVYPETVLLSLLPHWDMYVKAGVSVETLKTFKIGLAQKGKMLRRYVFPIYNQSNQLIGFSGRWHKNDAPDTVPKWKHLGDKRFWVWPIHLNKQFIIDSEEVIIVESPNCVLHLWEAGIKNVLCLFGTDLSPKLLKFLLSLTKLKRIIIATNNEPDNTDDFSPEGIGNEAAKDIEKKLLKWFDVDRVVVGLPPKKDFAICSHEEILQWKKELDEPAKIA